MMRLLPFPTGTTCDSRNVHQPGADRIHHQFRSLVNSQRVHDVGAVNGDSVSTEIERGGDFLVRLAIDDHLQDFQLPMRERRAALSLQNRGLLNLRIEYRFSGGNLADGGAKFQVESVLENVSLGPRVDRLTHPRALRMHAEHENSGVRGFLHDLPSSFEAVHAG